MRFKWENIWETIGIQGVPNFEINPSTRIFPQLCQLIRGQHMIFLQRAIPMRCPLREQESSQKGQQHVKEPVEYLHDCSAPAKDKVDARKYLRKLKWAGSHAMVWSRQWEGSSNKTQPLLSRVKKRFLVEVDQSHMLRGVAIFTNIPPWFWW